MIRLDRLIIRDDAISAFALAQITAQPDPRASHTRCYDYLAASSLASVVGAVHVLEPKVDREQDPPVPVLPLRAAAVQARDPQHHN